MLAQGAGQGVDLHGYGLVGRKHHEELSSQATDAAGQRRVVGTELAAWANLEASGLGQVEQDFEDVGFVHAQTVRRLRRERKHFRSARRSASRSEERR
ncbi:MAG: hypothetical protein VCC04_08940, partial [Myxococcota bacterium]